MSFQWIIDHAETISMNRLPVVASTTARDGTTRSVSRGYAPWTFTVKVADGIPWTTIRPYISQAEFKGKTTADTINFAHSGYDWLIKYQGDFDPSQFYASWTSGQYQIEVIGGSGAGLYKFRAGDVIQLSNTGRVYTVAADCPFDQNTVTLHRPVLEESGGGPIQAGANCNWTVQCTAFPNWSLMARDQVSWDGSFTFVEAFV